jgi:hypothetical protein
MDGMSGMKIYNKLNINTKYLPTNYPDIAEFLIKNIIHKIENNKWYTTLESIITIKGEYKSTNGGKLSDSEGDKKTTSKNSQLYKGQTKLSEADTILFLIDVLKVLCNSTPNSSQIRFMKSWRQAEGGNAAWNPFNTTLSRPGSLPNNIIPNSTSQVQNYTSRAQGLEATLSTLKGSKYVNIVKSINSIKSDSDINIAMNSVNNSPWGTVFSRPADYKQWKTFNNYLYSSPIILK